MIVPEGGEIMELRKESREEVLSPRSGSSVLTHQPFECHKRFAFKVSGKEHDVQVEHRESRWRVMVGNEIVHCMKHGSTNPFTKKEFFFELLFETEGEPA